MIRGTTTRLLFAIPFDTSLIKNCYVTLTQGEKIVLNIDKSSLKLEGKNISYQLSQQDTLELDENKKVRIQIRVLTVDGDALASKIYVREVGEILYDEVIS